MTAEEARKQQVTAGSSSMQARGRLKGREGGVQYGMIGVRCADNNSMPLKKKKTQQLVRPAPQSPVVPARLFSLNHPKEQLLEALRRRTLFHCRLPPSSKALPPSTHQPADENWLSQIKLGTEEEQLPRDGQPIKQTHRNHRYEGLPAIVGGDDSAWLKSGTGGKRCDKLTCFQRKLMSTGAWNKQNTNGIGSNIAKISGILRQKPRHLNRNDFSRVAGLTSQDRSFDQSLLEASAEISMSQSNPFSSLSFCLSPAGKRRRPELRRQASRKKGCESEGHFVPAFLLSLLGVGKSQKGAGIDCD